VKHVPAAELAAKPKNLVNLVKGLSAHLQADYVNAGICYESILSSPISLVRTGHDLSYRGLLTTMALSGNLDGMILALERWSAPQNTSPR
jgi:hypothetical protein